MNIIKLDATSSTNDFLKKLNANQVVKNFTVVTTLNQTAGKGQMGSVWESEAGRNLIMSVLVRDVLTDAHQIFGLNVAVSVAVAQAFKELGIRDICVKWPNDIMSGNFKLGGILIENIFKSNGEIISIVGIGLNINQEFFKNLPHASSLFMRTKRKYEIDLVRDEVLKKLRISIAKVINKQEENLWQLYHDYLFKIKTPMTFENTLDHRFMGIIQQVNSNGQLEVLLENDQLQCFDVKEIKMLY
jgi:BirA family biotin operon repressor/biotin-[acetyl-CoA-carboxylase] ligase